MPPLPPYMRKPNRDEEDDAFSQVEVGDLAAMWDDGDPFVESEWVLRGGFYSARAWVRDHWDEVLAYATWNYEPDEGEDFVRSLALDDPQMLKAATEDYFRPNEEKVNRVARILGDRRKSRIILITGDRGGGKTGLAHMLAWLVHTNGLEGGASRPVYFLSLTAVVPWYATRAYSMNEIPAGAFVLMDESGVMAGATEYAEDYAKALAKNLQVARHNDITVIFITPNSASVVKNVPRYADWWIFKSGGFGSAFERPEVVKLKKRVTFMIPKRQQISRSLLLAGDLPPTTLSMGLTPYWNDDYSKSHRRLSSYEEAVSYAWEFRMKGYRPQRIAGLLGLLGFEDEPANWEAELAMRNGGHDPKTGRGIAKAKERLEQYLASGEDPPSRPAPARWIAPRPPPAVLRMGRETPPPVPRPVPARVTTVPVLEALRPRRAVAPARELAPLVGSEG